MKKTLTFLSVLGAMASSAIAGTVTIAPAPVAAPAVCPWASACSIELCSELADQSVNPNMWGPRFTYSLYKAASDTLTHELNASIALLWGEEGKAVEDYYAETDVFQAPIMLGYNANYALCDKVTAYAGAKVGMSIVNAKFTGGVSGEGSVTDSDTDLAFRWAIGTGIKYAINEQMDLILGYEFARVYSDMHFYGAELNYNAGYHVINLGVSYDF